MPAVMADTHAVVWYLQASPQLSAAARSAMQSAIQSGDPIYVSAISLVEIAYLSEKGRLPADTFDRVLHILQLPGSGLLPVSFDISTAAALRTVPSAIVPDMPDRMIAATAVELSVPLVTADQRIRAAPLPTIW